MDGGVERQGLKRQDRRSFAGIPIVVEYRPGDIRTGKSPSGRVWSRKMKSSYGRVVNTKGLDGDPLDVYIGPNPHASTVFTVDQLKGPEFKELDEQKHMLGYDSMLQAKEAYLENYPDDRILGGIKAISLPKFMKYVQKSKMGDPQKLAGVADIIERIPSAVIRKNIADPKPRSLRKMVVDIRRESPSKIQTFVDDRIRKITAERDARSNEKVARHGMTTKLSTLDELNLARVSAGKEPVKIAKEKSRTGEISGQLAGIPLGTATGKLVDRLSSKTRVGHMPLAPFVGMAAGPIIGGEIGRKIDESRVKKAGILFKAVRGVGNVVDAGLRAAGPKNIAKAGVLTAGAGTVAAGYKGVGAAKRLAKRPKHGFSTPRHQSLGRAF